MDNLATLGVALPETEATVRKMLHGERSKLEARAAALIKQIESERDRGVRQLDRAAAALAGEGKTKARAAQGPKKRRARGRSGKTTAEEARERRLAVHRYMEERARPLKSAEIAQALKLPEFSTKSALRRLIKDGTAIRTGTGTGTRYRLASQEPAKDERGTAQGRIITTIEDRGSASAGELAQAAGIPVNRAERECADLIVEGVIRMIRRGGAPMYVMQAAA